MWTRRNPRGSDTGFSAAVDLTVQLSDERNAVSWLNIYRAIGVFSVSAIVTAA